MAEQRKGIVPPKIPPPPPPRSRTPKNNAAASLLESTSPPSIPGATTNKTSPTSPPVRQQKIPRPAPSPPDLSEAAKLLSSTSPPSTKPPKPKQNPPVQPFGPRLPPVSMNPAGRDSPTPKSPSSAADLSPTMGFFQNVYSRTKDLFSRKKTTTYEPLPKQSASLASPPTSPQKRGGFFKSLFDSKSTTTTTTTPIRLDDSSSDTESSPDRYSGDKDYSKLDDLNQSASYEVKRSADSDLEASGTSNPQVVQFADTVSEISASDLEEAEALRTANSCRISDHREDQLLTIQTNSAADIRVATTVTGDVTTCVRTATGYKGRK